MKRESGCTGSNAVMHHCYDPKSFLSSVRSKTEGSPIIEADVILVVEAIEVVDEAFLVELAADESSEMDPGLYKNSDRTCNLYLFD